MKTIIVNRYEVGNKQSLGVCYVFDENNKCIFRSECIERGWLDNKSNVSCIPVGEYPVVLEHSPRFRKDLWEIYDVPGRSECKFHAANYARQLNGCIALGMAVKDIDSDGFNDITSSRIAMGKFHKALEGEVKAKLIVNNLIDQLYNEDC